MPSFHPRRNHVSVLDHIVQGACFGCRATPGGERHDAQNPHRIAQRQRYDIAWTQARMWLVRRLAIEAHMPFGNQPGAIGARLHESRAPQPLVEPLPVTVFSHGIQRRGPAAQRRSWPSLS